MKATPKCKEIKDLSISTIEIREYLKVLGEKLPKNIKVVNRTTRFPAIDHKAFVSSP